MEYSEEYMVLLSQEMKDYIRQNPREVLEKHITDMICKGADVTESQFYYNYGIGPEAILIVVKSESQEVSDKIKAWFEKFKKEHPVSA